MRRALAVVLAFITSGLVSLPAAAQQASFDHEVSVFGSWDSMSEPVDAETTLISLRYGKYFSSQLVGTLSTTMVTTESGGFESSSTTLTVGAKYYINPPQPQGLTPFVDGSIGVASTDTGGSDSTDLTWELGGGVSWFFSPATSFDAALHFYQTDADIETSGTRLTFGITTRF